MQLPRVRFTVRQIMAVVAVPEIGSFNRHLRVKYERADC